MSYNFEKFDLTLKQCNQRLRAASIRVRVERKGHALYARGTLPPKPNSGQTKPYQQHVSLNVKATPAGLKRAEAEARKIAAAIDLKEFSWTNYPLRSPKVENQTVADWRAAHKLNYFEYHQQTPKDVATFQDAYDRYLKRLPQTQPLTAAVLERVIKNTEPDSRNRLRMCIACRKIGQFAGIDVNFITKELQGTYSSQRSAPRDLPDDEQVAEFFYKIPNSKWRWIYGMIATFGLRPHEVFHLDTQDLEQGGYVLKVLKDTKTGYREVRPLHPEWVDEFDLRHKRFPNINVAGKCNQRLGKHVTGAFSRYKIPFPPYHLRHCYAVRCIPFNIQIALAARWMGHSVAIHTRVYQAWISKSVEQEAFEQAIQNPNRPQPPSFA